MTDPRLTPWTYAWRTLRRAPFFTTTAVLSLAIGIGANTAIFTAANALLLAPTGGIAAPNRVVDIGRTTNGGGFDTVSYPTYLDVAAGTADTFTGVYAARFEPQPMSLNADRGAERVYGQMVSGSFFRVLGLRPAAGGFWGGEERPGVPLRQVVLSHAYWARRFDADLAVVGRSLTLNGDTFDVAGVTPEGFASTTILAPDVFVPLTAHAQSTPTEGLLRGRENSWLILGARLAPGVSIAQARQAVSAVARQEETEYPQIYRSRGLAVERTSRLPGEAGGLVAPFMAILMGLVAIVQIVACANLTGMLLARTTARSREIAVRLALGASRRSVVGLLMAETLLLFGGGGVLALGVARWTAGVLASTLAAVPFPISVPMSFDWRVFAFTGGVTLLTGGVTALVPALQGTRPSLATDLKSDAGAPRRRRLRHAFVIAQVAACFVLVVVAALFVRALNTAGRIDTGMQIDGVDVASLSLDLSGQPSERWPAMAEAIQSRFAGIPGVARVGAVTMMPLQGSSMGLGALRRRGDPSEAGEIDADWNVITPGYLATIGVPIVRGRDFDTRDRRGATRVAIVNERLAERTWPGEDPIGKLMEYGDFRPGREDIADLTVVGVSRNAAYRSIGEAPQAFIYVPEAQYPLENLHFFLRRAGEAPVDPQLVRDALRAYDPNLPLVTFGSFRQQADIGLLPQRIASVTAGVLGVVALALAAIGIYGLTAFAVASRTRELGVRVALGADPSVIRGLVLRQSLRLTVTGGVIGLLVALGLSQLVRSLLYGVSPLDPVAFGLTAAGVATVGLAAALPPARRAARVDPVRALRAE